MNTNVSVLLINSTLYFNDLLVLDVDKVWSFIFEHLPPSQVNTICVFEVVGATVAWDFHAVGAIVDVLDDLLDWIEGPLLEFDVVYIPSAEFDLMASVCLNNSLHWKS